jgi:hypothetical protein
MLNAPLRILIVAGICVVALIALVLNESAARSGGTEVLLPMEAVDPRSLLSGHYVTVMPQQQLDPTETCPMQLTQSDRVSLAPTGETVSGGSIYGLANPTATLPDALTVKGSFTCNEPIAPAEGVAGAPGWIQLDLNINRFHINQTEALRIEQVLRDQNVTEQTRAYAIVSIGRDGRARLKGLLIDGQRLELNWL